MARLTQLRVCSIDVVAEHGIVQLGAYHAMGDAGREQAMLLFPLGVG